MFYFETFKFTTEKRNLSQFGLTINIPENKITFLHHQSFSLLKEMYLTIWEPQVNSGRIFIQDANISELTPEQKKDWFFEHVTFIDNKKLNYQHQTLEWVVNNLKMILNKPIDHNYPELKLFDLFNKRRLLIKNLNQIEKLKFQLVLATIENRPYVILAPDFLNYYTKNYPSDLEKYLHLLGEKTILGFTTTKFASEQETNWIHLNDPLIWQNPQKITIYNKPSVFHGYKNHFRTQMGLILFIWKRIWKFWLPVLLVNLITYIIGVFMLLIDSVNRVKWLQITGFFLISFTAALIAVTTIISYFRLRTQYTFLQFISISERYVNMILPVFIFTASVSICLLSYLFNFLFFLADSSNLSLANWMDTLYVSTAFVLWSIGICVFVVVSFEKNYNILKLLGLKKWKENLMNKKPFGVKNSKN